MRQSAPEKFPTAIVTDTLDFLSDATGYVVQPFAEAMNNQGTIKRPRKALSRQSSAPNAQRGLQRQSSMSRIPPKNLQMDSDVITTIQALLESQSYISSGVLFLIFVQQCFQTAFLSVLLQHSITWQTHDSRHCCMNIKFCDSVI